MRVTRAIAWACALSSLLAEPAAAQPTQAELREARDLFALAERDERAGDFTAALEKLRRVAQIKTTPGIRFHIALSEEKTGQLVLALSDYAQAEKQATDEKNREVLAALKEPLEALRARIPRVIVRVPLDLKGVEVTLDGKALASGYFGAEVPVDPKAHTIEARAPGKKPWAKSVTAPEREITTVDVVLEEESKAAPTPPPPPPPLPTVTAEKQAPPPPAPPPPHADATQAKGGKTGAILATSGAVLLAGAGVGAFLLADGKQSDARDQCAKQTDCQDLRGPVRTWDAVALGAWIGGGALAAVAVVLWLSPDGAAKRSGRIFVGPGSAGVAGTF